MRKQPLSCRVSRWYVGSGGTNRRAGAPESRAEGARAAGEGGVEHPAGISVHGEGEGRGQGAEAAPDGRQHPSGKADPMAGEEQGAGGLPAW